MGDSPLDELLSIGVKLLEKDENAKKAKELQEIDLFGEICSDDEKESAPKESSLVHTGDADSDDELHKPDKYNDYGRSVNDLLKHTTQKPSGSNQGPNAGTQNGFKPTASWLSKSQITNQLSVASKPVVEKVDVYTMPLFGIRVIKPLISSKVLLERMEGKDAVTFAQIKRYTLAPIDKDWVMAGVVVSKSNPKVSQKGSQYSIWVLSDLHSNLKTISLFLFGNACKELWKTTVGTVVGILNPTVFEKTNSTKDEASLSISNPQRMMIFGQSKDLGTCRSTRKDGTPCTSFVNTNICEYCIYHIKQEYQKCTQRSELQANFGGGGLTALRNKVLGKNEVFYAGRSFTSIPAKKSAKLASRDEERLRALSGNGAVKKKLSLGDLSRKGATCLDVSHKQRAKDLELLKRLGGGTSSKENTVADKVTPTNQDNKVSEPKLAAPTLKSASSIDLNVPISRRQMNAAKQNALKFIQKHGPLKKLDPMNTRGTGVKRALENVETTESEPKKAKNDFYSDRFKKIMAATSKHADLVEEHDNQRQEKYFDKLEVKERIEEKMSSTFKMQCKAVTCLKCKYTNFSASEMCKAEKHPLKVTDATKRFFKCGDCGNRTVALTVIPVTPCTNCGSGKWEKTGMIKEKKVEKLMELSIRGGEQKFLNSGLNNSNLDLLVPDA